MLNKTKYLSLLLSVVLLATASISIRSQTEDETTKAAAMALLLFNQERYAEAVPYFEVVVKGMPDDKKVHFLYGWCLLVKSKQISDTAEAQALSSKALEQFKKAKRLGLNEEANDSLIAMLSGERTPASQSGGSPMYSKNAEAEKAMNDAENLFAQSKYDEALKLFEKALALDPTIYQAGTSGGDCYVAKGDWENAEKWYQKSIAIDPNRETAYRYSATPLMKQQKYDLARDRYIEAFIVEPYNPMSARGINQWAMVTKKNLEHPAVDIPEVSFDATGKAVTKTKIEANDPWSAYVAVREVWKKEKFLKTFPKEAQYRHSLPEEIEALRGAVKAAEKQKSTNVHFQVLGKLDKEGLLEAFVLLAKPDDGIAEDHAEYLKNNRPKLRLYFANYVIQK